MFVEQSLDEGSPYDTAAARSFDGGFTREELEGLAQRLSRFQELASDTRACVILGYGSQPTALYRELAQKDGAELLWHANYGPWWLAPLMWIAASHGGLFKVVDAEVVAELLVALSDKAMVELYSFPADLLEAVEEHVRRHTWRSRIASVVGGDPGYFRLGVDGGSPDAAPRISGWCSFGDRCPAELQAIVLPDNAELVV